MLPSNNCRRGVKKSIETMNSVSWRMFCSTRGAQRVREFSAVEFVTGHLRSLAQVMNGVVISADDPASSLYINDCTFEGSYTDEVGETRGLGGAVYARGSLSIENSTFSENNFIFEDDVYTPSPFAGSFVPSPETQVKL